jgi:hypothetical protein
VALMGGGGGRAWRIRLLSHLSVTHRSVKKKLYVDGAPNRFRVFCLGFGDVKKRQKS